MSAEIKPGSVSIAYVHAATVSESFNESLDEMRWFDVGFDQVIRNVLRMRTATSGIADARNACVRAFLADEGAEWLLFVDTDMGFAPDSLYRLLVAADPVERPIVGALCFASREIGSDDMGGARSWPQCTIFDFSASEGVFRARTLYPVAALTRCAATGSAFILIHRSVFEKIGPDGWYDRQPAPNGLLGEDLSFCARAGGAGIPVHVLTAVRTTHHKARWLAESDFWQQYLPEPADERVEVIVPVVKRPGNAEPFMRSLRASTGLARVTVVADSIDEETRAAWRKVARHDDQVIARSWWDAAGSPRPGTFAEKVNHAFERPDHPVTPWILLVGDDVRFYPGWLDHAQAIAKAFNGLVIGTNDLGNPATLMGEHSTHLLIRREYVKNVGASWDGPGIVCHEGYHHNFVDNEIVTAAKDRGVWQMAMGSIVEHNHPQWAKAESDETYRLGASRRAEDEELWRKRFEESRAVIADA